MYDNIPVNKRPDYLEHQRMLNNWREYLVFLGFNETMNDWCSYEYTTIFKKNNIEIRIVFDTSTPSSIRIVNTDMVYDESKGLSNVVYLADFNEPIFDVVKNKLKELIEKK